MAMFITNNALCIIPGCNPEISAFMFTFGSVARKSLAKLRNNLSEHPTTESTLLEECEMCLACFSSPAEFLIYKW